jgi:hypothetical protein
MPTKRALNTLSLLLICFAQLAWSTPVYVWKAEDGSFVHSDRPPSAGISFKIQNAETGTEQRARFEADIETTEVANHNKNMQGVDLDASYCQRAQSNLKTLDSFSQIRTRDDEGNYRYLTVEEKEEQRQQAMLLIDQFCE